MKTFIEHLSTYAKYHRDPRNIATHLIGVPIIVFSVIVLFSRPAFEIAGVSCNPAMIGFIATMIFYFKLDFVFGVLMAILMGAGLYAAHSIAAMSTTIWLTAGIGMFVAGWAIQFVGHHYEGKKPAFVDDLVGLLIGPLFVTAEMLFSLGMYKGLKEDIEARAGTIQRSDQIENSI